MKLIDFLEVVDENKIVSVLDSAEYVLTVYDGKESINKQYNDCEILNISIHDNDFIVKLNIERL